jgi:hypothetical protein
MGLAWGWHGVSMGLAWGGMGNGAAWGMGLAWAAWGRMGMNLQDPRPQPPWLGSGSAGSRGHPRKFRGRKHRPGSGLPGNNGATGAPPSAPGRGLGAGAGGWGPGRVGAGVGAPRALGSCSGVRGYGLSDSPLFGPIPHAAPCHPHPPCGPIPHAPCGPMPHANPIPDTP